MIFNYPYSKIYKITSEIGNVSYIGSTTQRYLCNRMGGHKHDFKMGKNVSSKEVLIFGDAKMELMENFPCESITELRIKEGEYIQKNECVNKVVAGRTTKQYYQDNKIKLDAACMEHRNKNKEGYLAYQKLYRDNHEVKQTDYREKNKEKYLEYQTNYRLKKKMANVTKENAL